MSEMQWGVPTAAPDGMSVEQMALFHGLDADQLATIKSCLHTRTFPANAPILHMTQISDVVYFVQRGTVKIFSEDRAGTSIILAIAGAGIMLGDTNALDGLGHPVSSIALEPCTLLAMERATLHDLRRRWPIISENLLQVLARRTRLLSTRLHVQATASVAKRLAIQLLTFALEYGQPRPNAAIYIPMRLTQSDLADLIGASRQYTNQQMTALYKSHIVSLDAQYRITIHDQKALACFGDE